MKGALVILAVTVLVGVVLYFIDRLFYRSNKKDVADDLQNEDGVDVENEEGADKNITSESQKENGEHGEVCCGLHLVCEKNSLSPVTAEVEYYDDEELDRFKGRAADSYDEDEEEEFRDILLSMLPEDVAGWSRSLQLRGVVFPSSIREEVLMIVNEERQKMKNEEDLSGI